MSLETVAALLGKALASRVTGKALDRLPRIYESLKQRGQERFASSLLRAEAVRSSVELLKYLAYRYEIRTPAGYPLLRKRTPGGVLTVPGFVIPVGSNQDTLESLLGLPLRKNSSIVWKADHPRSKEYINLREHLGARIQNLPVFAMCEVAATNEAKIYGQLTTYRSCLAYQDGLEWELLSGLAEHLASDNPDPGWQGLDSRLTLRSAVERNWPNCLLAGSDRPVGLAIATLIVARQKSGSYDLLFWKRSAETANHADLFHVVPSCMFQPEMGAPDLEWSLTATIMKEYGEELFDKRIEPRRADPLYYLTEWEPVRELGVLLADKSRAQLVPTGVFVNLLNHRPEVCALLLVHDADWWASQFAKMKLNWEFLARQEIYRQLGRTLAMYPLSDAYEVFNRDFRLDTGAWVPPGIAAFVLGVDKARDLVGE